MEDAEITQEEAEEAKEGNEAFDEEEKETPEKTESEKTEKSKDLQSALAQKEHFRTKYEKSLEDIKTLKKSGKVSSDFPTSTNPMEVVKLAKSLEGYNEDEVDFIVRNASDKSVDGIVDATKDEWVKTAITAKREKVEGENKTPSPSSPSSIIGGKTDEELEKMDDTEYAKWLKGNVRRSGGV